jgi:dolichol-phosphate mannosyltransferase
MRAPAGYDGVMRISVLVPAYDEERTIGTSIARLRAVDLTPLGVTLEIVIVDDGSHDGTAAAIAAASRGDARLRVLRHPRNRGKGAALLTALSVATGEACLVQDADLEYDVDDYRLLVAPLLDGAAAVYGSRFLARRWPPGMQLPNLVANYLLTATANALFGLALTDEATCLKLIRTDLLRRMGLQCSGFEFCPEVTAKLGLMGVPIVEVPVRYQGRSLAEGKKVSWRDGVTAMATLWRHRPRRASLMPSWRQPPPAVAPARWAAVLWG